MEINQDSSTRKYSVLRILLMTAGMVFLFLLLCSLIGYMWHRSYMKGLESKLDAKLKVIRDAGYPVTLSELDAWYPAVKDEENAALLYQKAFDKFAEIEKCDFAGKAPDVCKRLSKDDSQRSIPIVGTGKIPVSPDMLSEDERVLSSIYLDANRESLQVIKMAAKMAKCRNKIDLQEGYSINLPHINNFRNGARLLALEALLASEKNEVDTCLTDIEGIFSMARSLDREPVLISYLVRNACVAIAINAIENLLSRCELDDFQLQRIMVELKRAESSDVLDRSLAGENAMFLDMDWNKFVASEISGNGKRNPAMDALLKIREISGISNKTKLIWIEFFYPIVEDSKKTFPMALVDAAAKENEFQRFAKVEKSSYSLSKILVFSPVAMMMPGLSNSIKKKAQSFAMLRASMIAVSIERYRLKNHKLPETLEVLVPEFLPELPQDPFTGVNFKYKHGNYDYFLQDDHDVEYPGSEKKKHVFHKVESFGEKPVHYEKEASFLKRSGYIVYSVSGNLTDEDGFPDNSTGDIPFRVAR